MELVLFFILAIVAVAAGVGVIAQRNTMRSALFLLINFCCLAGLYVLLNAQFLAIVQVIIYAGAVVVLFLFAVMLLGSQDGPSASPAQWIVAGLLSLLLLAGILLAVGFTGSSVMPPMIETDNVRALGIALTTDFAIPFELASIVLLVAIIGAVVLAKRRLEG